MQSKIQMPSAFDNHKSRSQENMSDAEISKAQALDSGVTEVSHHPQNLGEMSEDGSVILVSAKRSNENDPSTEKAPSVNEMDDEILKNLPSHKSFEEKSYLTEKKSNHQDCS